MNEFKKYVPTEAEMRLAEESMTEEQRELSRIREEEFASEEEEVVLIESDDDEFEPIECLALEEAQMGEEIERQFIEGIAELVKAGDFDGLEKVIGQVYNAREDLRYSGHPKVDDTSPRNNYIKIYELIRSEELIGDLIVGAKNACEDKNLTDTVQFFNEWGIRDDQNLDELDKGWLFVKINADFSAEHLSSIITAINKYKLHDFVVANPELRARAIEILPEALLLDNEYSFDEAFDMYRAFGLSKKETEKIVKEGFKENLRRGKDEKAIRMIEQFEIETESFKDDPEIEELIINCAILDLERDENDYYKNKRYDYWSGSYRLIAKFDLWEKFLASPKVERLCQRKDYIKKICDEIKEQKIGIDRRIEANKAENAELFLRLSEMPEGEFKRMEEIVSTKIIRIVKEHMLHDQNVNREYRWSDESLTEDEIREKSYEKIMAMKEANPDDWYSDSPEENCYDHDGPEYVWPYSISFDFSYGRCQTTVLGGHWEYTMYPAQMDYIESFLSEEEREFIQLALLKSEIDRRKQELKYAKEFLENFGIKIKEKQ